MDVVAPGSAAPGVVVGHRRLGGRSALVAAHAAIDDTLFAHNPFYPSADAIERLEERDALKLLAHLLLPSDPSLEVEIDLAFRDSQTFRDQFAPRFEERGVEPSDPIDVWVLGLCDGLAEHGRVGIIDWRASIEDIIAAVEGDASPLPITLPAGPGWRTSRMPTSKLHAGSSLSPTTWQNKVGPWPILIPIPISTL
jgi:hypothetical protein